MLGFLLMVAALSYAIVGLSQAGGKTMAAKLRRVSISLLAYQVSPLAVGRGVTNFCFLYEVVSASKGVSIRR